MSCEDSFVARYSTALRRSGVAVSSHSRLRLPQRRCFATAPRAAAAGSDVSQPEQLLRENAVEASELGNGKMEFVEAELPVA